MTGNPFVQPNAPAWLTGDPPAQISRLLDRLLEVAAVVPALYEDLPWLREVSVLSLLMDQIDCQLTGTVPPTGSEARVRGFFARVTQPIAALVEALYTAPLLRERRLVGEILRRMARAAGQEPLGQAVINALCAGCLRRRLAQLELYPLYLQPATWQIRWQPTPIRLRDDAQERPANVVLVTDEAAGTVLAIRVVATPPATTALPLALYDALVFPRGGRYFPARELAPPAILRVQAPLPAAIGQAARVWQIAVEENTPPPCALVEHLAAEVGARVVDHVQLLHILDRACERRYG